MESPEVKIGDDSGTEPQVVGQILYDMLDELVTAIQDNQFVKKKKP